MAKSDRLLLILNLVRSRRNLKASDLAKECEVSERTIFRDIQALSEARVPVYFEDGYKLLTDAFLPPLNFTVDELIAICIGLNSDPVQSVNYLRKSAKHALVKLESLMSEKIKADYEKTKQKIAVQPVKKRSQKDIALLFELLRQTISQEKKVKVHCVSAHSSKVIELVPKALVYKKENWYLAGEIQKETRHFRLDMIKSISLS